MRETSNSRYAFYDRHPALSDVRSEVLEGLRARPKRLSAKFFYDEAGSRLFEEITRLPEYYLTRTELALFDQYEAQMRDALRDRDCVVEYGSGSNLKIRRLLEIAEPQAYVPVDISKEHLIANARALLDDYPDLSVYPLCADFAEPLELPDEVLPLGKMAFFPGSSIGNFEPSAAGRFLANVAQTVGAHGQLLIGVDRKKDKRVLEAAYDDAAGVTAQFNLNMLTHINEQLSADFDVTAFRHAARYNEQAGRIEMHLISEVDQEVVVDGTTLKFAKGESIHTENSYKYHPEEFLALATGAGFREIATWTDDEDRFAVYLLEVTSSASSR